MTTQRCGMRTLAAVLAFALSGCGTIEGTFAPLSDRPPKPARIAGPQLSADEARRRAGAILSGTEYGESAYDVISRIKAANIVTSGSNDCGPIVTPLWVVTFETPHKGALAIDAVTGTKQCSSLPFAR